VNVFNNRRTRRIGPKQSDCGFCVSRRKLLWCVVNVLPVQIGKMNGNERWLHLNEEWLIVRSDKTFVFVFILLFNWMSFLDELSVIESFCVFATFCGFFIVASTRSPIFSISRWQTLKWILGTRSIWEFYCCLGKGSVETTDDGWITLASDRHWIPRSKQLLCVFVYTLRVPFG